MHVRLAYSLKNLFVCLMRSSVMFDILPFTRATTFRDYNNAGRFKDIKPFCDSINISYSLLT